MRYLFPKSILGMVYSRNVTQGSHPQSTVGNTRHKTKQMILGLSCVEADTDREQQRADQRKHLISLEISAQQPHAQNLMFCSDGSLFSAGLTMHRPAAPEITNVRDPIHGSPEHLFHLRVHPFA